MNAEEVLKGLNDGQKAAVMHINGPSLCTATAGAGKTRVIVARAQYMILNGIDPSNILLTTFTNKAANEMKERIVDKVGEKGRRITVGTYHSICNRILRQHAEKLEYNKTFTIMDENDSDKIIKQLGKAYNIDTGLIKTSIAAFKAHYQTPQQAMNEATSDTEKQVANMYQLYQDELKRQMAMDFDDLIFNTIKLLESFTDVREEINNRWRYISSDESQDMSIADTRLTYLLSGPNNNIFFVGDDYQAIYGFRFSDVDNMINLQTVYPNLKMYNLGINYRSTETIVNVGKSIIANNSNQIEKEVSCGRGVKGMKAVLTTCKSQQEQSKKVVAYIKAMHSKGVAYKDIAILYRNNYLSRNIEKVLMENKIKYKIFGGVPFFNRAEIQDVLSYLRLLVNPYDFQAFKRSIGCPKRGVGDVSLQKIENFCRDNNLNVRDAIAHKSLPLKGKAKKSIDEFVRVLNDIELKSLDLKPYELIQYILLNTGYYAWFRQQYKGEDLSEREQNLQELVSVAKEYDNIEDLVIQASLYKEELEDDEDAVNLLTIHKSKGLEFTAVMIIDLAEGCLPSFRSTTPKEIEEERRLMFVAATRAKDYLFMLYPQNQVIGGQSKYVKISRFLKEIDPNLITRF